MKKVVLASLAFIASALPIQATAAPTIHILYAHCEPGGCNSHVAIEGEKGDVYSCAAAIMTDQFGHTTFNAPVCAKVWTKPAGLIASAFSNGADSAEPHLLGIWALAASGAHIDVQWCIVNPQNQTKGVICSPTKQLW